MNVFVYGTLMPGGGLWEYIEPYVMDACRDNVRGRLYNVGKFPAFIFDEEADDIPGWTLTFVGRGKDHALKLMDTIEGRLYNRVKRPSELHDSVWLYEWNDSLFGLKRIDSWDQFK